MGMEWGTVVLCIGMGWHGMEKISLGWGGNGADFHQRVTNTGDKICSIGMKTKPKHTIQLQNELGCIKNDGWPALPQGHSMTLMTSRGRPMTPVTSSHRRSTMTSYHLTSSVPGWSSRSMTSLMSTVDRFLSPHLHTHRCHTISK